MKFGLAFEISVPRPWTRESEKTVYDRCLEQAVLAEELGFDYLWAVEHHFLEEYAHCSSPELFLTACAMLTRRIRLGHGIVVCVPEYSSPIRIAERTATLDILSGGRLEVGTGRSATWTELAGFRADPDSTKKSWDEFVHVIPKMWTQERFSYEGLYFSMPQRTILPKPYQKPHPPMWVAVSTPGTEIDAAERGLGSLGLSFGPIKEQEEKVKRYRQIIRNCDPVGELVNENIATTNFLFCHEDDEQGVAIGRGITQRFLPLATQFVHNPEGLPTRPRHTQGLLAALRRQAGGAGGGLPQPEGLAIGNPERIVRELKKWEAAGVDVINFILNVLEVVPQEQVLNSMRLFAREVMPHFKNKKAAAAA